MRGKERPASPPTIFESIPPSVVPTPQPKPRTTIRVLSSARSLQQDETNQFEEIDKIIPEDFIDKIKTRTFNNIPVVSYQIDKTVYIQSSTLNSGVPVFLLEIFENFEYKAYQIGVSCVIPSLSTNRITTLDRWSRLLVSITDLNNMEVSHKKKILADQRRSMGTHYVGKRVYSTETLTRAFEYFAMSRTTYSKLREDYQLPSVTTLTRLISKVGNTDDLTFIKEVVSGVTERQRTVIIMADGVHVKSTLPYHGGKVFGRAQNNSNEFQYEQVSTIMKYLTETGANFVAIISDGNRVNKKFVKMFDPKPDTPWVTKDEKLFLLYDYVHLMKCIRNNWLTEKCGEILFQISEIFSRRRNRN